MKRRISILFIFMLLFQSMASSFAMPMQAIAAGVEQEQEEEKTIIRGYTVVDGNGEVVDPETIEETTVVTVLVEWSVESVEVGEDTTESIKLASELNISEEQSDTLTNDVGVYNVSKDGTISVSFNETILGKSESSGTFEVAAVVTVDTPEVVEEINEKIDEEPKVEVAERTSANVQTIAPLAELTQNIFEFRSLTHNGNLIEDGSTINLSDGTKVELIYDWHTEGLNAKNGDTATIQLPDVFEQITTPAVPLVTSGITVGTYQIQNGELQIIFNENIEDGDVSDGEIGMNLDFSLQKFEENIEQVINFNDKTGKELNVIARPTNLASAVTKEGHPDQTHNAKEITWTVDVMNNSSESVTTATLADILPEGLGEPADFVITELSTGLNGDKVIGETVDNVTAIPSETGFELAFGNLEPYQGYRVQYTTPITDRSVTEFTNDAVFFDGESNLPAKATVSGLTASNPIEKSGSYNKETGQIDWIITANENGSAIEKLIIDDLLPAGLSVDEEKFAVEKFVNGASVGEVTVEPNDFPVNLGSTAANEHYVINFSTNIDYGAVNDGNYQTGNAFENVATLNDGEEEVGRDEAVVEFNRQPLLEKRATSGGIDYENKKISWIIDLNKAQHNLKGVIVTDTLPAGLTLTEDDITITNSAGETVEPEITIAQGVEDSEGGDITFDFGDIGTQHITIKYETEITSFDVDSFANTAKLEGEGIGEEEHTTTIPANPPANSFEKNYTAIDYNAKTMNWNLKVNPIREGIESLVIEDTFPNKGMILIPDTVNVSHSENGDLVLGQDYTLESRTEDGETGYHKGFIIKLIGEYATLNGGILEVNYQTSYDPQFEVEGNTLDTHPNEEGQTQVYLNNAHYSGKTTSGHDINVGRGASTTVRADSWNSGKKEGQLVHENSEGNIVNGWQGGTERKIAWQLYTNYQKQNLGSNVVITDTLQYEGSIDEDSIRVSTYTVDAGGETVITDNVLDPGAYSVDVNGDTFTLSFNQEVSERYVIELLTTVPNTSQENYTNEAIVSVDGEDYPYSGTVNYENYNNFLDKSSVGQEGSGVYIGDEINWEVQVNDSLSIIDNAEITDIISAGLEYVQGTLEISTVDGNTLSEGEDYVLSNTKTEDGRTRLNIELNESLNQILILNYTKVVTAEDGDKVSNEVTLSGDNIESRTVTTEELTAEQFSWASGEFNPNRGALQIVKSDSETGEPIANNSAVFELYYELNGERVLFADEIQTDENGEILIGNLPLRTYYLVEVEAPTGYIIDGEEQVIEITEPYGTEQITYDVEFMNTKEKTDVSVTKEWNDEDNQDGMRPSTIAVQLLANGEPAGNAVTLSQDNEWANTWTGLDAHQSNGEVINYTVEEVIIPEGYESAVSIDDNNNITVTNTHVPELTEVAVSKEWDDADNQDGVRPNNVTVNLLNGSEIETSVVLNEANNWQHTFNDLPKFANGEEIQYSVTENTVAEYSTSIETTETDTGLNSVVTNAYTPEETSATVTKVWNDGNNQDGNRPGSISVQLFADGEAYGDPVELIAEGNWTHTWTGLDLNADGAAIDYTVEELEVAEDYEVSINNEDHGNMVISNAYTPEVTEVSVSKEWDDADNQDGVRPENVTINLLADGEVVKTTIVDTESEWQHTFTDLPVYNNGNEINYTVTENAVTDYTADIVKNPDVENEFVITNSHTPNETSVTITKSWNDANNQDGNRPNSILVQLSSVNGDELVPVGDSVEVFAAEDWTYTWTGLDENEDGQAIKYTVEELNVPEDYTVSINDADHGNIILTNSYTPETTEVPVTKVWDDADNQDGERPSNITLNLLNDRGEIVKQAVVQDQESNEWKYVFTDLPKFENGTEINYSVTENFVSDYSTETENSEDGIVITNTLTPDETSVTVTKGWNDSNNQDNVRPDSIEVQLNANGEAVGEPVVITAADNWTYTWNGLDLNADGEAIDYSVEELNVPEDYEVSINDSNHGNIIITNAYEPELIEIPVQKVWDDGGNQDGIRPDRVEVNLLADGEKIKEAHITEASDWQHVFTDLPKFKAGQEGQEVIYTLNENSVGEYSLTSNEFNEDTGIYELTNSYTPEETTATVTKKWNDADNQDGIRPGKIEVQLLANDEATGDPVEIDAEDDWTYTWEGLPLNTDGEPINYSVEELNLPEGYETTVNDENHGNLILTNNHTPEEITISGMKTWDDANNQDGIRPATIKVNLFANDDFVESVDVTDADDWSYSFENLPKFEAGEEITYTITENEVEGYQNEIDGFDITNTHTPEVIDVNGTKTWDDADNQDGIRPESITVNLLANGEQIDSVEVTAENDWKYSFVDLPKYENGKEITYTVTENAVESYTPEYNGFDITNHYTPGETAVTVTKHWDDANNQDRIRPESIEVQLIADGEVIRDAVELSEVNDWTHTWTELPEKAGGTTIVYTVEEITDLPAYDVSVHDEDHANIIITNAYTPEEIEITGTKTWEDNNNEAGKRPTSITVNLYASGELSSTLTVFEEDNWNFNFTNLPKYSNGEEIEYTITEEAVEGYESTIDGFNIINTLIEEEPPTPSDPEDPTPEETETSGTGTEKSEENKLPSTATNMYNMLMIGLALLILGIAIALYQRRRQTN